MPLPSLTLVLGGAASGKSSFAETLCFQSGKPKTYIATAQAFDDEMQEKISAHRAGRGSGWTTLEAPIDVGQALATRSEDEIVLLDCVTLWLSNIMLADHDTDTAARDIMKAISDCAAQVIVVSNEVGQGIVPDNKLARQFRNAQGRLNQLLAADAELVVQVISGLPQILKGRLP